MREERKREREREKNEREYHQQTKSIIVQSPSSPLRLPFVLYTYDA